MSSEINFWNERRTQTGSAFRAYLEEFGYHRISPSGEGIPRFTNSDGDILTQQQIESTSRYMGFAEAKYGSVEIL